MSNILKRRFFLELWNNLYFWEVQKAMKAKISLFTKKKNPIDIKISMQNMNLKSDHELPSAIFSWSNFELILLSSSKFSPHFSLKLQFTQTHVNKQHDCPPLYLFLKWIMFTHFFFWPLPNNMQTPYWATNSNLLV